MTSVTGRNFSMLLSIDNVAHSIGNNEHGQLGIGENTKNVSVPTPIRTLPTIKHISCGLYFTACIDFDGFLYTFGDNTYGQLGVGTKIVKYNTPQKVQDIPKIKSVSCGGQHTLIITNDSKLWSVGKNDYGQLCLNNTINQINFQQTTFSNVEEISAGCSHSFFQSSLRIYGSGYNSHGQLGLGHNNTSGPCKILYQPPNIVQFCCGFHHTLFLDANGNVYSVGLNTHGRLGLGNEINQNILQKIPNIPLIQSITCAGDSSYLIDVEGNLWSFGRNLEGQLGLNDLRNRNIPTKVGLKDITTVSGSFGYHFFAKNNKNRAFILGCNNNGQLGIENVNSIPIPQEFDESYSEDIWGCPIEDFPIYQEFEEMQDIFESQNNGDPTFIELENLENKLDENPNIEEISEVEQNSYDKVTMYRLITAVHNTKKLEEKSEIKKNKMKTKIKEKTNQVYSKAREKIYPKYDETSQGYINVKELEKSISEQFDIIFENQNNFLDKNETDKFLKEKINEINEMNKQIEEYQTKIVQLVKMKGCSISKFKKIERLANKARHLIEKQKDETEKICNPESWILNFYKKEKIQFFKNCIQCYGEEQFITYKALAIGTVKRKSDDIEKLAKFSHQITKGGIAISECVAVGFVPGFGAIGFISAFMSFGRKLMKFYKNIETLKQAKKILNHTGRNLKDIYKFVEKLSEKFIETYKDQIHSFSLNSIKFIAQLLIEQSIPILLKEQQISIKDSISRSSSVLFPQERHILYQFFDRIISPYCIQTDDGVLIFAKKFLRNSAFRSRKNKKSPFEYLIPYDEKKQNLSKTLEFLHIDPFRTIPYADFLALQNSSNNSNDSNAKKITYLKSLSEDQVKLWKKNVKDLKLEDINLETKGKNSLTYCKKLVNFVNSTPEIKNKRKRREDQPPAPGGDCGFIEGAVDLVDGIYVNYLHIQQMITCYNDITAESGDTKDDFFSILSFLATLPKRAIVRDAAAAIIEALD